ncbi:MAG: potassium-transporting ATPase subunit KdpC [Phycisphaerae bacterium]|nr:potassium-transporting ATPase subunit KdpC [Phycisphaerae bacterium]
MWKQFRPAIVIFVLMTLLTGVVYPWVVTGIAQVFFPHQANGSLVEREGRVVGSELIGQPFDDPKFFWGRLSATDGGPYNGGASGGSNYGPMNEKLTAAAAARIAALRQADPDQSAPVPADLVTASGSGLDPDISVAAALYQVPRVARARGVEEAKIRDLVMQHAQGRQWGVLGEPRVNVLRLNLALEGMQP